jgi:DNA ligase-1
MSAPARASVCKRHSTPLSALQRLAITSHLVEAFQAVISAHPTDLLPMVYLCTGRVAPPYEGVKLGIGDATLLKVPIWIPVPEEGSVQPDWQEE